MSCVCYGPVQLVSNTPFTVLEHEHVKKVFLYLQKQFSYKVFSIIFNTSEKVVLVIWKVNFYKDHDSSFFFLTTFCVYNICWCCYDLLITAALKHGIRNPETETESRKRKQNTESVKEGSKRSIWKKKY